MEKYSTGKSEVAKKALVMYEVGTGTIANSQVDALSTSLKDLSSTMKEIQYLLQEKFQPWTVVVVSSPPLTRGVVPCQVCQSTNHTISSCVAYNNPQEGQVKDVSFMGRNQGNYNNFNSYNRGNHPSFNDGNDSAALQPPEPSLREMMQALMGQFSELQAEVQSHGKSQKMLETQLAQQVENSARQSEKLPNHSNDNPRGSFSSITTRSDLQILDSQPNAKEVLSEKLVEKAPEKERTMYLLHLISMYFNSLRLTLEPPLINTLASSWSL